MVLAPSISSPATREGVERRVVESDRFFEATGEVADVAEGATGEAGGGRIVEHRRRITGGERDRLGLAQIDAREAQRLLRQLADAGPGGSGSGGPRGRSPHPADRDRLLPHGAGGHRRDDTAR